MVLILIPLHCTTKLKFSDDINYMLSFENIKNGAYSLSDVAASNYLTWSSRVIIESLTVLVVPFPFVWAILDIGAFLLIAYSISCLIESKQTLTRNVMICSLLLIYPFQHMGAAGWVACTVGYLWTTAALLYTATLIKKIYNERKLHFGEYITYTLAVIFAANNEQANLCLMIMLIVFGICFFKEKIKSKFLIVLLIVTLVEFFVIMLAPGNEHSMIKSIQDIMPQFNEYNLFEKMYMAYSYTMNSFIIEFNPIYFFFSIVLAILSIRSCKSRKIRFIGIIPCVFSFLAYINPWERLSVFFTFQNRLEDMTSRREWIPFIMSIVVVLW